MEEEGKKSEKGRGGRRRKHRRQEGIDGNKIGERVQKNRKGETKGEGRKDKRE